MGTSNDELFDKLIPRIRDGDCVLFLGPELFLNKENNSLYSAFSKIKCDQMNKAQIKFDGSQADNIYYTVNRYIKGSNEQQQGRSIENSISSEKKAFINLIDTSIKENELYSKLAKLPFYLTINTNPDDQVFRLQQANAGNRKYRFGYYDFTKENNEVQAEKDLPDEINPDNFVVYNVYGHATRDRARSIIISESEFVNFSRMVNLPGNGMPACIKNFIKNEKVCLFLGFRYESWPLKILLNALGFLADTTKQNISFVYNGLSMYQQDFYRDEMKFLFIESNANEFIDELAKRYGGADTDQGLTIQPEKPLKAVFISKAFPDNDDQKQDIRIREKISAQLRPLQLKGYISLWSEDLKMASENEPQLIKEKYESADIFILLGSDTLADQQVSVNMQSAIDLVKKDKAKTIVPVYVRYFSYDLIPGIDAQNWIPKMENKPVPIIDKEGNEDKKCTEVSEVIRKLIHDILLTQSHG
jgi:hypothetical protein